MGSALLINVLLKWLYISIHDHTKLIFHLIFVKDLVFFFQEISNYKFKI